MIKDMLTELPSTSILKYKMKEFMEFDDDKKYMCVAVCMNSGYDVASILGIEFDMRVVYSILHLLDGKFNTNILNTGADYYYVMTGIADFIELLKEVREYLLEDDIILDIKQIVDKPKIEFDVRDSDIEYFRLLNIKQDGMAVALISLRHQYSLTLSKVYMLLESVVCSSIVTDIYKLVANNELVPMDYCLDSGTSPIEFDIYIDEHDIRVMKRVHKMVKEITNE